MIKLIINGDDFGMTDGVCRAIRELLDAGAISSTSVMVAVHAAPERCKRWGISSLRGVAGVHLQLTNGRPTLKTGDARALSDPSSGCFRADIEALPPELVLQEWRAQIDLAADLIGASPSHLDSHRGLHHLPGFVDVYITLAREYRLPVRGGSDLVCQRMMENKISGTDVVLFDWTGRDLKAEDLKRQLVTTARSLGGRGSIEVVSHPGYCDAELIAVSSLNTRRNGDRMALHEIAASRWLTLNSFVLVSYSELGIDKTGFAET